MMLFIGMFSMIFLISLIMGILSPDTSEGQRIQFILFRFASNLFNSFQLLIPYIAGYLLYSLGLLILFIPFSRLIILNDSGLRIIESFLSGDLETVVQLMAYSINFKYLLLYFLPCFYMWIKIQFFPYLIISKELGPIEALKKSYDITEGQSVNLILFLSILVMINLIGLIPLGLGLVFTIPFSLVATGVMFTKLDN